MAYAAYWMKMSQPSQATPSPAAPASTAKPAQFEKAPSASAMAAKPGAVTTATGGATGKEAPKAKPETNTMLPGATVIDMPSSGATVVDMTPAGAGGPPSAMPETAPVSGVKAAAAAPSPPAAGPKEPPKDSAKSTTTTGTVKGEAPKVDAAKALKPAAAAAAGGGGGGEGGAVHGKKEEAKQSQTKVQVEVPSTAAKTKQAPAADPFDALADILPSSGPDSRPAYTGPEVSESAIVPEKGHKCGERDDTLPPGYRWSEMASGPAEVKPRDDPKPLTTDQAMDSLLDDFATSAVPAAPTKQEKESVVASSAGPANFAPPPAKKGVTPVSPAPPADKKAKMENVPGQSSLEAGRSAPSTKTTPPVAVCPPADKKAKLEKDPSLNLDALGALGDTLPTEKPKPESPKLKPGDIVSEDKLKKEKGVRVGERDDSIPPEYRFKEDKDKKLPPLKPEPSMGDSEALDLLSEGFGTPSAAPAVQAPVVSASAAPAQKSAPADKKAKKDDFSLEAGLAASTAKKVESSAADKVKATGGKDATDLTHKKKQGDSLSLDALSALGDTLPTDKPKPEAPKLRPEDIVSEDKLKKEKGVRVGERDDSIPPEYRFKEDKDKKLPPLKPEPSMDDVQALDLLSEGFAASSTAASVQAPAQGAVENLSALEALSGDLVAPTKASGVQSQAPSSTKTPEKTSDGKPKIEKGDSLSLDALSALGDTLPIDKPKPESPKVRPEDIVSEGKLEKKKGVRVGERDDSIPPEYRFKEDKDSKAPAPQPEPSMETDEALDILSGGFSSSKSKQSSTDQALEALGGDFVAPTAASTVKSAAPPTKADPQPATGEDGALDALSDTLKDIKPAPQPAPVPAKAVVKEKKAVEEKVTKMGERDDSLPPEYRPTEEDRKKMKEEMAKRPKESMDEDTALDLLSGGFSTAPNPDAKATAAASCSATTKLDSDPKKPMAGPALDSLAGSLLPDSPAFKSDKTKKHQAEQPPPPSDLPPAQRSSDVVPTSTKKAGKS